MSGNVREFIESTKASERDALAYLSRAGGDLQAAVGLFLSERSASFSGMRPSSGISANFPVQTASKPASRSSLHKVPRHRFATFSDLSRQEAAAPPPNDDPAQFFTGGEHSGLAVTNPNSRGPATDAPRLVNEIIRKAQQRGTSDSNDKPLPPQSHFSGSGFRLGRQGDTGDEAVVDDDEAEADDDMKVLSRTMYFWSDGFSIDDGPLFRFDDPRNDIYLRAINMGHAPIELLKVNPRQPVDVKLVQKPNEDYQKPKLAPSLDRAGHGQRLGGPSVVEVPAVEETGSLGVEGDAAVQLRLADGSTHRLRFTGQGPVQQLYDFIDLTNPSGRPYVIQAAFPPRRLENKQQSLESAGVIGAVVVQRFL